MIGIKIIKILSLCLDCGIVMRSTSWAFPKFAAGTTLQDVKGSRMLRIDEARLAADDIEQRHALISEKQPYTSVSEVEASPFERMLTPAVDGTTFIDFCEKQ